MKLLFDQNLSFKLCQALVNLFPGSSQVRLLGLAEADDRALWQHAKTNSFILVTQDSDFADMAALYGSRQKSSGSAAAINLATQSKSSSATTPRS
jgi:predicted nuclease of predicted toxin-antitoxin system